MHGSYHTEEGGRKIIRTDIMFQKYNVRQRCRNRKRAFYNTYGIRPVSAWSNFVSQSYNTHSISLTRPSLFTVSSSTILSICFCVLVFPLLCCNINFSFQPSSSAASSFTYSSSSSLLVYLLRLVSTPPTECTISLLQSMPTVSTFPSPYYNLRFLLGTYVLFS